MKALIGLLLLVFGHDVSSVIHSLQFFHTASSGLSTFPEYVEVQMVNEVQIEYYDSNTQRIITKQDWVDQANEDKVPDYLERETERKKGNQQVTKGNIGTLKKRFNQTGAPLNSDAPFSAAVSWCRTFSSRSVTRLPTVQQTCL
ncbi:unnamed protein product [Gadus morhua 'NCC']